MRSDSRSLPTAVRESRACFGFGESVAVPSVREVVIGLPVDLVQGQHRRQNSDVLGTAGIQLGPGVGAPAVELQTVVNTSLTKVADLWCNSVGLHGARGGLVHLLHRVARDAARLYAMLAEQVLKRLMVVPGETRWRLGAVRHWLWGFGSPTTKV